MASPPEAAAPATHTEAPHKLTRKRYLRLIDQQLQDLKMHIDKLRTKKRSFTGPERDRLAANIQMLEDKLHEARSLRNQIMSSGSGWRDRKKELDAKVIRLRKSLTYVKNGL